MSELSMVSFSANASRVIPGQEITLTCKLKNISGSAINYWAVGIGVNARAFEKNTDSNREDYVYVAGGRVTTDKITWKSNATKTFVWTVTIPESASEMFALYSGRAVPLIIRFTTAYSQNYLASDTYVTDLNTVAVLDMYYTPKIDDFHLVRATDGNIDEEGASVLTTIKLSQADGASESAVWNPVCMLHYAPVGTGSEVTEINLTSNIPALLAGIEGSSKVVQGEISPGNDYQFALTFGDDYESAVAINEEIVEAFANFALSETGKGASFGGFPRSTADEPMLESHYPGHFYAGFKTFGGGEFCTQSQTALGIQSGALENVGGQAGGTCSDHDVTFPTPFAEGTVPVVVVSFRTSSSAPTFGNCTCSVHSKTNTGFTIRFFNGDTSNRSPGFDWIAVGQVKE